MTGRWTECAGPFASPCDWKNSTPVFRIRIGRTPGETHPFRISWWWPRRVRRRPDGLRPPDLAVSEPNARPGGQTPARKRRGESVQSVAAVPSVHAAPDDNTPRALRAGPGHDRYRTVAWL
ncbi:hypothetical protein SGFS_098410 [Streptomyces graminofaciens]|uniref:Uncharacterized protein n=1 Tax=Streptomyces graminofaciens TaxID=68212 RepID=A0ABN5VYL2_9ACTN|nr:hypothetical protein SGFS_098410 [Streptomyces graminofaciens]